MQTNVLILLDRTSVRLYNLSKSKKWGGVMKYIKYIVIILIFLSSSILTAYAYLDGSQPSRDNDLDQINYITVLVEEGDTIWNLAREHNSGSYKHKDLMTRIKNLNELVQYLIFPGQALKIPL